MGRRCESALCYHLFTFSKVILIQPIETLGDILTMGSAGIINCLGEKEERFLVLFEGILVVFDVDCKQNSYILKVLSFKSF